MNHENDTRPAETASGTEEYSAPKIESVITPADLEREVHYAGVTDGVSLGQP